MCLPAIALAQSAGAAAAPATAPAKDKGVAFVLRSLVFHGNSAVSTGELDALAASRIGRDVTLADLEALAADITRLYRSRGYFLAQALVPQQDIREGQVEMTVLEGRLGKVDLRLEAEAPISEARIRAILAHVPVGAALQADGYERTMLLLSDLPGIKVKSGLQQGVQAGTTDLVVEVARDPQRWQVGLEADNYGTPASGVERASVSWRYASPLHLGDSVDLMGMTSIGDNQTFGHVGYEAPLGADGLRLGASASRVDYNLGADFAPLDATGIANVFSITAGYPLLRSRSRNAFLRVALETKSLKDVTGAVGLETRKRVNDLSIGPTWESHDTFGGEGYTSGSLTAYAGHLSALDDTTRLLDSDPVIGHQTAGSYGKLAFTASRLQALFGHHDLFVSVAGQWTDRNLDASEKLLLGGNQGVRAYSSDELLVDAGAVASVEWRYAFATSVVCALFYDIGTGDQWRHPHPTDAENRRTLRGAGLGVNWDAPHSFSLRASLAWPIGDPPRIDPGNTDPRLLLQVQKVF